MISSLSKLFQRDIGKLKAEMDAYDDENNIWVEADGISNSGGNLCLHLIGNLNHFIGHVLAGTDYERQRDLEFSAKNVPVVDLQKALDNCSEMIVQSFEKITPADLEKDYPIEVGGVTRKTELFVLHLLSHLSYHIGQINYHRRMLDTAD